MKYFGLILISAITFSCKSDLESIQGHWHDVTFLESNRYMTLDIEDSSIFINKYDRAGMYGYGKIKQVDNDLIAEIGPYGENYLSCKIFLKSDTLFLIGEDASASLWVRHENDLQDIRKDISSSLLVKVSLAIDNSSIPFDSIDRNSKWAMINIGYPNYPRDKFPKDTLLIHLNDAIADFSEIDDYFENELESIYDNPQINSHDSIIAIINADKNTPDIYFDSLTYYMNQFKHISAIYRTYLNDDFFGLGLKRLQ